MCYYWTDLKNEVFMKKMVIFVLLALLFLFSIFPSGEKEYKYSIDDMGEIVKSTKGITSGIKKLSDNYVIRNTKKSNELLSSLHKDIESNKFFFIEKNDEDKVEAFLKGLKTASDFYKDVTSDKNVRKTKTLLLSYYDDVKYFSENVNAILEETKSELRQLNTEYEYLKEVISKSGTNRESEKKIASYEKQIKFTEMAIDLLEDFSPTYERLLPPIEKIEDDIDFFILTLKETAKVFDSAYRTAELSKNILNAYDVIEELGNLNSLSDDMQNSWGDLEVIVGNLVDMASSFS